MKETLGYAQFADSTRNNQPTLATHHGINSMLYHNLYIQLLEFQYLFFLRDGTELTWQSVSCASSIPRIHVQSKVWLCGFIIPELGRWRRTAPWGSMAGQPSLIHEPWVPGKCLVSQKQSGQFLRTIPKVHLCFPHAPSTYAHTHAHTNTNTHTNTHAHTK